MRVIAKTDGIGDLGKGSVYLVRASGAVD